MLPKILGIRLEKRILEKFSGYGQRFTKILGFDFFIAYLKR